MQRIFVSYHFNSELSEQLVELVKILVESNDMLCVRGKRVHGNQSLRAMIFPLIDGCDAFISIMTSDDIDLADEKPSKWVAEELDFAMTQSKECLLLVNAPPCSIPKSIAHHPRISFDDTQISMAAALTKLAEALRHWKSQIKSRRVDEWRSCGEVMPVALEGSKVYMRWETLGEAIGHLYNELRANKPNVDAIIGINEVGLACASYLSNIFDAKPVGYAMHHRTFDRSVGIREFYYPEMRPGANVLIVDTLLKSGSAFEQVLDDIRRKKKIDIRPYLVVVAAETSDSGEKLSADNLLRRQKTGGLYVAYTFRSGIKFAQRCLNHTTHSSTTVLDYTSRF